MKKINILFCLLILSVFLSSCSFWIENKTGTGTGITTYSSFCDDEELKDCNNRIENVSVGNILKINKYVCNLQIENWVVDNKNTFVDFNEKTDEISGISLNEEEDIKELKFTIVKNKSLDDFDWRNINIMFDLTYFSGDNNWDNNIEEDVFENRKKVLESIILDWIDNFKIEYGDKINLFYIGTIGYWDIDKSYVIKDKDTFILEKEWNNLSGTYNIKYSCDNNARKRNLVMYYHFYWEENDNIKKNKSNVTYVSVIDELKTQIIETIDEKYNKWIYNRGTYLLESLDKNKDFINWMWSVNILVSDMFFQLHPIMKKNKKITTSDFDFTEENILKLGNDQEYTNFYNEDIPVYLKKIWKCEKDEELHIIWIELSDNLDLKIKMKEYYKEIFFKWCNVFFN